MVCCFISEHLHAGYIGGYSYTANWLGPYLEANYGSNVAGLTPHGVIVMDTMMNYDTNRNSQVIPQQYMHEVLKQKQMLRNFNIFFNTCLGCLQSE